MKCWIFHDWRPLESWDHWQTAFRNDPDPMLETCIIGSECRRCGRRQIKKVGGQWGDSAAPGPYREALNWMKEEVNNAKV